MSGQMAEEEGKRWELLKRLLPSFSRGRVRSEQSGRSRSELPMTAGTASTREFARRLCPVWALTGSAARPKAFPLGAAILSRNTPARIEHGSARDRQQHWMFGLADTGVS